MIALTISMLVLLNAPAQAYVDPGSGSHVFQLAVGTVVAASATLALLSGRPLPSSADVTANGNKEEPTSGVSAPPALPELRLAREGMLSWE